MALEIFKLVGSIFVDNDAANKSIQKTDEKAQGFGKTLLKGIGTAGKWAAGIVAGAAAATAAVAGISSKAVSSYADYEQLVGGVETLFGESADTVIGYADKAYKTAGLTANQYMDTVTSFSAALLQGLNGDTAKAAEVADMAITDMADNANKMGTDIKSIQNAYQGFAKGNYTMLDNLKLGYGGTKTEMERLLTDAEKLSGQKYDLSNLNDVYQAIHVVQTEMGVTGTTALEAESTISGGIAMIKAKLENFKTTLGSAIAPTVQQFLTLAIDNLPMIENMITQLAPVITGIFQQLGPPLLELVSNLLPMLVSLVQAILPVVSKIITAIIPVIIDLLQKLLPFIVQIIEQVLPILIQLIDTLLPIITEIINTVLPIILDLIQAILPPLLDLIQAILPVVLDLIQKILPFILQVTEQVLPMVADLLDAILPLLVQIVEAILPVFVELVETILPPIMEIVNTILPLLIDLFNAILPVVIQLIEAVLPVVVSLLDTIAPILSPILELLSALLEPLLELLNMILPPLITLFTEIIEKVMPPLQKAFSSVANVITTVFKAAFSFVGSLISNIKDVLSGIISFIKNVFTGNWKGAWEAVKKIFSGIWEGIKTVFKTPINWIISGINVFIRGINKIKIPDWVPLVGGKGFHISEIPALAQGGVLEKGQVGFLEGNGAEAVVPLHNNRKWIHAVAEDMDSAMGGSTSVVQTILLDILTLLEKITGMRIVLDTGVLAGELAEPIDERLGRIKAQKARA